MAVVGDIMVDRYLTEPSTGSPPKRLRRLSLENITNLPGGAANVMANA